MMTVQRASHAGSFRIRSHLYMLKAGMGKADALL